MLNSISAFSFTSVKPQTKPAETAGSIAFSSPCETAGSVACSSSSSSSGSSFSAIA